MDARLIVGGLFFSGVAALDWRYFARAREEQAAVEEREPWKAEIETGVAPYRPRRRMTIEIWRQRVFVAAGILLIVVGLFRD
ncbi:MAG: hypothetical protein ABR548_07050 [Actinomycetota bacterium]